MSKQKKKKPNTDALHKLQLAQSRNEFIRQVQRVCTLIGCEPAFRTLEKDMDFIFSIRPKAIKVEAGNSQVEADFVAFIKRVLLGDYKNNTTDIYEGGPKLTWYDYIFFMHPVMAYMKCRQEEESLDTTFKNALGLFPNRSSEILLEILRKLEVLSVAYSHVCEGYYQMECDFGPSKDHNISRQNHTVTINLLSPEWRQIRVGVGKRTAARVGLSFYKSIKWMSLKPSQLGIRRPKSEDNPLDVYIQHHAVHRLFERIGGRYTDVMNTDMIASLLDLKAFCTGGGNILIEHRISGCKAGYFAATITDQVLLIRTFLFLTHFGTPEGKKLAALTGLDKLDQKYLAFDNLLTLANSDILSNAEVSQIFRDAGCGCLLALCRKIRESSTFWQISEQENPLAERLLNYIKTSRDPDWPEMLPEDKSDSSASYG